VPVLERRPNTAETKFTRSTLGCCLLDHRRNEDILGGLQVDPVQKKLAQYKQTCKHVYIMSAGWRTLYNENNSMIIDLSEDEDLDDR